MTPRSEWSRIQASEADNGEMFLTGDLPEGWSTAINPFALVSSTFSLRD